MIQVDDISGDKLEGGDVHQLWLAYITSNTRVSVFGAFLNRLVFPHPSPFT
jgi:hypothetical protein